MANTDASTQSIGQFCNGLDAHARRCWALNAAMSRLAHLNCQGKDPMFNGVDQLIQDICQEAQRLADETRPLFDEEPAKNEKQ